MTENPDDKVLMRKNITLVVFILLVLVFLIAISGKRASPVPDDTVHAGVLEVASCLTCHAQGRQTPLKASHPPKDQCLICHASSKDCHPFSGGI